MPLAPGDQFVLKLGLTKSGLVKQLVRTLEFSRAGGPSLVATGFTPSFP